MCFKQVLQQCSAVLWRIYVLRSVVEKYLLSAGDWPDRLKGPSVLVVTLSEYDYLSIGHRCRIGGHNNATPLWAISHTSPARARPGLVITVQECSLCTIGKDVPAAAHLGPT